MASKLPSGNQGPRAAADSTSRVPGVNDPYELERWNPKLKLIREILLTRDPRLPVSDGCSPLHRFLANTPPGTSVLHFASRTWPWSE